MTKGFHTRLAGMLAALCATACIVIAPSAASAAPAVDGIYDLTGSPRYIADGPDGNVWVTLSGSSANNDIAKLTPAGVVTEYDVAALNNPIGVGSDGTDLWVVQAGEVVKVPPANPAGATATPIADIVDPRAITLGPDGNMWTASGDKAIKIPPANPAGFQAFTVLGMGARGISASSDRLWIADFGGQRIVSIDTAGADQDFYATGGNPQEVAASPAIDQVAFANPGAMPQAIGRINPPAQPISQDVAPGTDPFGVTLANDGAWWFAQFASDDLGRLTTDGAYTTLAGLPAGSGPRQITAGPNNTLWVSLELGNKVARVTGVEAPPPPPGGGPKAVIDKAPKKVKAGRKGAKAKFRFSSPTAGATFECALKRKGKATKREKRLGRFAACESPAAYERLRKGNYTFKVRATAGGETGATASAKLKVVKKKKPKKKA